MRRAMARSVVVILLVASAGCAKKQLAGFPLDTPPKPLHSKCRYSVEGCREVRELKRIRARLAAPHRKQMKGWRPLLRNFVKSLNKRSSDPALALVVQDAGADSWSDPNARYPLNVVVRIEYHAGSKRFSDGGKALTRAFNALQGYAKSTDEAWRALRSRYSRRVKLPGHVASERKTISIVVALGNTGRQVDVPVGQLDKVWRTPPDRLALVSLVSSEKGLKYRDLAHRELSALQPAFAISMRGSVITIKETAARRVRTVLNFMTEPRWLCDSLRAEARFFDRGQVVRRAWSVRRHRGSE